MTIPVMKPLLPVAEKLRPYLERIDAARYYSNHGPLLLEFEARLGEHFGLPAAHVAAVANGTTALSAALLATGAKAGTKCLVPSWTFVASAAAIWAANLRPHFVDVSAHTWMLDPRALRHADLADVGAVMAVSAFGAPIDTAAWDVFSEETGIPVVIDAAASFDTAASVASAAPGKAPMMISLHATKVLGVGEGALLLSKDEAAVECIRRICNFGVWGPPAGQVLGYNGKLSEYHAAVGLAALDEWTQRRSAIATVTRAYRDGLQNMPDIKTVSGYGEAWVSCYCNIEIPGDVFPVIDRLQQLGIQTRRWWRSGVHVQPAYQQFSRDELPVTEALAQRVFALPFYHDLPDADVARVLSGLRSAMSAP